MIKEERIVKEFIELVEIDSLSFKERDMADCLKKKLSAMGFDIYEDNAGEKIGGNAGNLICTLKGNLNKPCIMLSAHMDTVVPGIGKKAVIRDGYIYSDGTTILGSDDLAGIAAILEGIKSIQEEGISHGDIQVVFTVSEEKSLLGAANLDFSKLTANYGFIFDLGGPIGSVAVKAPTQYGIKAQIFGVAAHAGIEPENGISAIKIAGEAISNMRTGRISPETTANIGTISGGLATNIVCDFVELKCEARSLDDNQLSQQIQHMKDCFINAAEKFGGRVEIEESLRYKSINIPTDSDYYKILKKAGEISSIEIIPVQTGGGSDANVFNEKGIPSTALSIGMENVHSKDERVKIKDLVDSARLIEAIIKAVE